MAITRVSRLAAIAASTLLGCTPDAGRERPWGGAVDTLANGAVHVTNPAAGIWDAQSAWRLQRTLEIGDADGDGPAGFSEITDFVVDGSGRIYVLDGQAQEIRVFDSTGAFVRTIGRRGGGPGEFQRAVALRWGPDGGLWVVDFNAHRYAIFDTAGTYLGMRRRATVVRVRPWPGSIDAQGNVTELSVDPRTAADLTPALLLVTHRFDAELPVPVDTTRIPRDSASYFEHANAVSGLVRARIPYTPETVWRHDARGFLLSGFTDRYRIVRQRPSGDTTLIIDLPDRAVQVSAAERAEAIKGLDWFVQEGGRFDASRIPDTKPAFRALYADPEHYLWVTPWAPSERANVAFDVFDPMGRYLGAATADFAGAPASIVVHGRDLYLALRNEVDVPTLVRARIVGRH